jgi:HSP20 family molecular chaperone IbpA
VLLIEIKTKEGEFLFYSQYQKIYIHSSEYILNRNKTRKEASKMNKDHKRRKNDDYEINCGFNPFKIYIKGHPEWHNMFGRRGKSFDPFVFKFKGGSPFSSAHVEKGDEAYTITIEIPGVEKDNINLEVNPNELWLSAQNEEFNKDYREHIYFREDVNPSEVKANLKAGILTIIAPYAHKVPKTRVKVE